jgi:hypothetical protein
MEIERIKQEITNNVMEKILESMTPSLKKNGFKKSTGKGAQFSTFDDEEKDVIKEDDIKLNKKLQKSVTERGFIKKNFQARTSKGDLSSLKFNKEENGNSNEN